MPLHRAVQEGNLDIVKFLFDRGADIESKNAYNEEPLHLAIKAGRLDILKLLLDRGANINAKDKDGKTPLDVAKDQKRDVIIQYLEQAQLNEQLLAAVQDSDFSKVKDLINLGADVNIKDKDGKTPLHYVSRSDHHLGMVKYLISKGADIDVKDHSGRTPEDEERYTNSGTIRQVFMQAHLDKELLLTVKNERDPKTISDLIAKDIDDRTHSGFYYTWSGNLGTVEFLVSKDVSVNATDKYGCTLLHWSALKGHSDIAKFLIGKGANVNAKDILGRTPIHFAVMNNHVNITEFLLNQEVSVDETDKNGSTPLHYAAEFNELDSARFLIEKGANINTADNSGKKPIHVASENNNKNIIELFLSKGVSVDNADKDGWTSLHYAARRGCLGATEFLIEKGADTKAKDKNGQVPLCVAAQYNKPDIIDFLLNKGATIEASDFNDNTVLKLAYCIKGLIEKTNNNLPPDFEGLESKLPKSVKNLVFAPEVCITSVYSNEYLYAAEDRFNYDKERRRVFTFVSSKENNPPGSCGGDKQGMWKVQPYGDNLCVTSVYSNEYLYAAEDRFNYDKERRRVFTFVSSKENNPPGSCSGDKQGMWKVEDFGSIRKRRDIQELESKMSLNSGLYVDVNITDKNHSSRKLLAVDSSNQPKIAASSGTRPSSWINGLFSWVKSFVGGLLSSRAALSEEASNTANSIPQVDEQFVKASVSTSSSSGNLGTEEITKHKLEFKENIPNSTNTTLPSDGADKKQESNYFTSGSFFRDNVDYVNANLKQTRERQTPVKFKPSGGNTILEMGDHYLSQVDFNGTIMLLDLLIRKVTGQKYISTVDQSISPLEAQGYALNITKEFEKVVEQAAKDSKISMHRLNIDFVKIQKEVTGKIMGGKFNEILGILNSYVEKACPGREAGCPGKSSPKKFEKFIAQFNKGLLNQSIEQILHNRDGRLEVDDAKQMSLEPQSYLSNASVQGHSKVSTCLSDIGVTKLVNNLSR